MTQILPETETSYGEEFMALVYEALEGEVD